MSIIPITFNVGFIQIDCNNIVYEDFHNELTKLKVVRYGNDEEIRIPFEDNDLLNEEDFTKLGELISQGVSEFKVVLSSKQHS